MKQKPAWAQLNIRRRRRKPPNVRLLEKRIDECIAGTLTLRSLEDSPVHRNGRKMARQRGLQQRKRVKVLQALRTFAAFVSGVSRIVWHDAAGIHGLSLYAVCKKTGIKFRTLCRCIQTLRDCGYLVSDQRIDEERSEPELQKFHGLNAIRQFTAQLLRELGILEEWERIAKEEYARLQADREEVTLAERARQAHREALAAVESIPRAALRQAARDAHQASAHADDARPPGKPPQGA